MARWFGVLRKSHPVATSNQPLPWPASPFIPHHIPTCFLHSATPNALGTSHTILSLFVYYEWIYLLKCVVLENSHSALRQFSRSWMQEACDILEPYGIRCCSSIVYEKRCLASLVHDFDCRILALHSVDIDELMLH